MNAKWGLRHGSSKGDLLLTLVAALTALLFFGPAAIAGEDSDNDGVNEIVFGGQIADTDAGDDGVRDDKFDRNSDVPDAAVVEEIHFSHSHDGHFLQISGVDLSQQDEQVYLRGGCGDRLRFRGSYQSLPYRYGSGAKFVLGQQGSDQWGPVYKIADFSQQGFQDPDGNGTDFYTDGAETSADNALVQARTNDLLSGFDTFGLTSRRRVGSGGVTFRASKNWTFDFDARVEDRNGMQALGTGTYQRVTDVNSDTVTDSDYFFAVRGIEIPAMIDYRTTRYEGSAQFKDRGWFMTVRGGLSKFDNEYVGLTYDNPFWFDGVEGSSGSKRGLWEFGRASYEPTNEAWDVGAIGGLDLPNRTRITAGVPIGEHSQNAPLLPITTNPALIGTKDVNGDGVVDASDNPTLAAIPGLVSTLDGNPTLGTTLDASSDILSYNVQVTSKPAKGLSLTGRYRQYEYKGQEGIFVVPARAEYVESRIKTDFKGDQILHVPLDWSRSTVDVEASYRVTRNLRLKGFGGRKSYTYDQYVDTDDNTTRDSGSRAVDGTDDDFFGVTAMVGYGPWVSARATVKVSDRAYTGEYTVGFSGEQETTRQFDLANRERTSTSVQVTFLPTDRATIGVGYRLDDDDYPDSEYGRQAAQAMGWNANLNYTATEAVNLFAFVDMSEWDVDMHLRTKCANCPTPDGAAPWDIPNFDWFSDYTDQTTSVGGGLNWRPGPRTDVDFSANFVKGEVEQKTANPDTPVELNPANSLFGEVAGVALGVDFPTQETEFLTMELKVTRTVNEQLNVGLWWRYDDFKLDDFQWNDLDPYGDNFLTVDDATRYLFLDSRYTGYTAHVAGVVMKVRY